MSRICVQASNYPVGASNVTPSDATDLTSPGVGLWVGTAGNVSAVMENGTTATFTGVLAGGFLPFIFRRINATGTTATNMVVGR